MSDSIALSCTGLVKRFPAITAVDGISLTVKRGECFGLLGPNGAGKTTTVEMFEGLQQPSAGEINILGHVLNGSMPHAVRSRIGVQLQETHLADKMNVLETTRLFRSFYRAGRPVEEVLELLGLMKSRSHQVCNLSGGQRQRLALACALVSKPDILFLDEPTTGLDPQARHRIWDVVQAFCAAGGTALLTTHYMEEASQLCDRVAIIDQGRIIAQGTPAELINELEADQIITCATEPALTDELLATVPGITSVQRRNGSTAILAVKQVHESLPALLALFEDQQITLNSLNTSQPSLEDVFVHLTGRGLRDE